MSEEHSVVSTNSIVDCSEVKITEEQSRAIFKYIEDGELPPEKQRVEGWNKVKRPDGTTLPIWWLKSVRYFKRNEDLVVENIDLNDYLVPEELKYEGWNKDSTKYGEFPAQLYFGYTHKMPPANYTFDGWLSKKFSFVQGTYVDKNTGEERMKKYIDYNMAWLYMHLQRAMPPPEYCCENWFITTKNRKLSINQYKDIMNIIRDNSFKQTNERGNKKIEQKQKHTTVQFKNSKKSENKDKDKKKSSKDNIIMVDITKPLDFEESDPFEDL